MAENEEVVVEIHDSKDQPEIDAINPAAEQEFVLVKDVASGETMELPTQSEDNTIGLTTLTHAFPGAHGLKYKTDNGVTRALLIDSSGKKFIAPNTGWAGKCFTVIYNSGAPVSASVAVSNPVPPRAEPSWRSTSDQNAKRKKMMDDGNSTDSDHSVSGGHRQLTAKQKRTDEPEKSEAKRQSEDDNDEYRPTDLIVLGLPFKFTSDDLRKYFSTFGKLAMCEIKKDGKGESRGFGFIQFEDFESQLKVLARPAHPIGGRRCEVKVPLSKKNEGDADSTGIQKAKLFIGRLQEKTGESALKEFFLAEAKKIDPKAGIIDVFVPKPFRSFAFITFSSMKVVKELIKKGDYIIDGSSVSVSSAAPKFDVGDPKGGRRMMMASPVPDYSMPQNWRRPYPPSTDRFNEAAFIRPDQRKRTFMETGYSRLPMPLEPPPFQPMPVTPGSNQHTLASGFETLNLNQMPNQEMMNAYNYMQGFQQNQMMGPPPSRYQYNNGNQRNGRYDYGPPGSNRGSSRHPYGRDDFGYF